MCCEIGLRRTILAREESNSARWTALDAQCRLFRCLQRLRYVSCNSWIVLSLTCKFSVYTWSVLVGMFCYYLPPMKVNRWQRSVHNTIVSIGIVACLCFSIGEGLRLTPFPVTANTGAETSSDDHSVRKYGPLDVPTRVQSRNKRQFVDYAHSTPERRLDQHQVFWFSHPERHDFPSLPFASHRQGRAPPSS